MASHFNVLPTQVLEMPPEWYAACLAYLEWVEDQRKRHERKAR